MAKVWPVYEGRDPTSGNPWTDIPLDDAARILEITPQDDVGELSEPLRFGDTGTNLWWLGYRHVILQVGRGEAQDRWRPAFYKSPLSPAEAYFRLHVHRKLGHWWRDEWKKGKDADGEPATWFWAVMKANAPNTEWAQHKRDRIQDIVKEAAKESGMSDWVYVRFRKENEEKAAS